MNADHVTAGVGATSVTAMLAAVIAYWTGAPADVAASEAGLAVIALGAAAGIVQACLGRKSDVEVPLAAPGSLGVVHEPPRAG